MDDSQYESTFRILTQVYGDFTPSHYFQIMVDSHCPRLTQILIKCVQNPIEICIGLCFWIVWTPPYKFIQAIFVCVGLFQCKHTLNNMRSTLNVLTQVCCSFNPFHHFSNKQYVFNTLNCEVKWQFSCYLFESGILLRKDWWLETPYAFWFYAYNYCINLRILILRPLKLYSH